MPKSILSSRVGVLVGICSAWVLVLVAPSAWAEQAEPPSWSQRVQEVYVPASQLPVLLEQSPDRLLLPRAEYERLRAQAERNRAAWASSDRFPAPEPAVWTDVAYEIGVEGSMATIEGVFQLQVLRDGLQRIPLELGGVGVLGATLDGIDAALGVDGDGLLQLFVAGRGRHELRLTMLGQPSRTSAQQVLTLRLPEVAAGRMRLRVAGDIELKSGARVISREYLEAEDLTRFELLPGKGPLVLVMSLNSRLMREERVVVARSLQLHHISESLERVRAMFAMEVLHRPERRFEFRLPACFEVTEVESPMLSEWTLVDGPEGKLLTVQLREDATGAVPISISAFAPQPETAPWQLSWIEPLGVVGRTSVVGLFLDPRLELGAVDSRALVAIDVSSISAPGLAWLESEGIEVGNSPAAVSPAGAFFAPLGDGGLTLGLERSKARHLVTANSVLMLGETELRLQGGFSIIPLEERLFGFDFLIPPGWTLERLGLADGRELAYESYDWAEGGRRVHVPLQEGGLPGIELGVVFTATAVPPGWVSDWEVRSIEFPRFALLGTDDERGAVAVSVADDLDVRPVQLDGLTPLDEKEKAAYGLAGVESRLAYRYESGRFGAELEARRIEPRVTARGFHFFTLNRDLLRVHEELQYEVTRARADRVRFSLPLDTPQGVSIQETGDVGIKEYIFEETATERLWTVTLTRPVLGAIRIALDFEMGFEGAGVDGVQLPCAMAVGVAYQSGYVAVEGDPDLAIEILEAPRRVDLGELVDAAYQPGRRLLGVYGFVGPAPRVRVRAVERVLAEMPLIIVERGRLLTLLSAHGLAQSEAVFRVKAKAAFLGVRLPKGAALWSAHLDGNPAKPQVAAGEVVLSLPVSNEARYHELRLVYESNVAPLGVFGTVALEAPQLILRDGTGETIEVPVADLEWDVQSPNGFQVVDAGGAFSWDGPARPRSFLHRWLGAVTAMGVREAQVSMSVVEERMMDAAGSYESLDMPSEMPADEANGDVRFGRGKMNQPEPAAPPAGQAGSTAPADDFETRAPDAYGDYDEQGPVSGVQTARSSSLGNRKSRIENSLVMKGKRSLEIQLTAEGGTDRFYSLGQRRDLRLRLMAHPRIERVGWGIGLAVFLAGLWMTFMRTPRRWRFMALVAVIAWLILGLMGGVMTFLLLNPSLLAACTLLVLMPALTVILRLWRGWLRFWRGLRAWRYGAGSGVAAGVMAMLLLGGAVLYEVEAVGTGAEPFRVEVIEPGPPIQWPENALVIPYVSAESGEMRPTGEVLIPYAEYRGMWEAAHGTGPEAPAPPVAAVMGAAEWSATLDSEETLLLRGQMHVHVWVDEPVLLPLKFRGGILSRAELDGVPARLQGSTGLGIELTQQQVGAIPEVHAAFGLLVEGKGTHRLELELRFGVRRQGGWRMMDGVLPAGASARLKLMVPEAGTEVRWAGISAGDAVTRETTQPGEVIETVPGLGGVLELRWRPRLAEVEAESGLTVHSEGLLDVQEDRIDAIWELEMLFRRGERDTFTLLLPGEYSIAGVDGLNVRGWQAKRETGRLEVRVELLKPAKERESIVVHIWRPGPGTMSEPMELIAPTVEVRDSDLQNGRLSIRRSPLLDIRIAAAEGVSRMETTMEVVAGLASRLAKESPLGIEPFQTYEFARAPFMIRLTSRPLAGELSARLHGIVKVSEQQQSLEARLTIESSSRSVYGLRISVPSGLEQMMVEAPTPNRWSVGEVQGDRKLIHLHLVEGRMGSFPVLIRGMIRTEIAVGVHEAGATLPVVKLADEVRQQGDWVLLSDPEYEWVPMELEGLESLLLSQVASWLGPQQRQLAALTYRFRGPEYAARFRMVRREAEVRCSTISNVRLTERSIDETLLLNFTVERAGIRNLSFLLPERMRECRVDAPMLRQKTVEVGEGVPEGWVRFVLEFQDSLMGELRVLLEHDRVLEGGAQTCPLPIVETGRTVQRYAVLENAGRDELRIVREAGLSRLSRQQKEWAQISPFLGGGTTLAYHTVPGGAPPELVFETKARSEVETAGARIGLAETSLVVDAGGAYRAELVLHIDNRTEQVLGVRLPEGARLWTALVAGLPVKPSIGKDGIEIPLVKTAEGDLDYRVQLTYAGELGPLGLARRVAFPLIRSLNINIELSHVRLYLPEDFAWFNFGGSLRRVEADGDLEAEVLAYQNRQVERLVQTLKADNAFAQARATTNLSSLRSYNTAYQRSVEGLAGNAKLATELSNSAQLFESAAREVQQQAPMAVRLEEANYDRLRRAYREQRLERSRGRLEEIGLNWAESAEAPGASVEDRKAEPGRFNRSWFFDNSLLDAEEMQQAMEETGIVELGKPIRDESIQHKAAAGPQQPGFVELDGSENELGAELVEKKELTAFRRGSQSQVSRYAERLNQELDDRSGGMKGPAPGGSAPMGGGGMQAGFGGFAGGEYFADGRSSSEAGPGMDRADVLDSVAPVLSVESRVQRQSGSSAMSESEFGLIAGQDLGGAWAPAQAGPGGSQPALLGRVVPSGMSSLAVEIPRRGGEYRFTSPRGESLELTVRAVGRRPLGLLLRLSVLGMLGLGIAGGIWLLRRRLPGQA